MKKPDSRRNHAIALLCTGLTLAGCNSTAPSRNHIDKGADSSLSQETGISDSGIRLADERGIGGSGKQSDETGIGGSGIQLADERGIGGSGKQSDETGIGGSGIRLADERGIGGSGRQQAPATERWLTRLQPGESIGVVGTINDFGSIWVNGLHIHFDQDTRILMDGNTANPQQLELGQRAVIHAQMQQGALRASKIELIHEVIGPVSQRNPSQRQLTVLGQTVQLTENQSIPDIGSWVAVSGQRVATQQINASRIDKAPDQQTILLRGTVSNTQNQLSISQFSLPGSPVPAIASGNFVTLRGQMVNHRLTAIKLSQPQRLSQQPGIRLLSIERSGSVLNNPGPYSPRLQGLPAATAHRPQGSQVIEAHVRPGQPPVVDQIFARPPTRLQQPIKAGDPARPPKGPGSPPPPLHPAGAKQPARPPQPAGFPPRPGALDRPATAPRPEATVRPERPHRPEAVSRPDIAFRPVRPERPEIIARPERPQRPDVASRPERPQRPDKPQRPPR